MRSWYYIYIDHFLNRLLLWLLSLVIQGDLISVQPYSHAVTNMDRFAVLAVICTLVVPECMRTSKIAMHMHTKDVSQA
jgi:hypothetical protein